MGLDVKSVDRLLGTSVPYAYAIKAGPWIFLTGHEAYDWETGTSDEVTGPPGFPLHGRQRSRREGDFILRRMRRVISPGTPNSATTSRRAPRWSWRAASPPTLRYRRR